MKILYILLLSIALAGKLTAQTPDRINYQAVIRSSSGQLLASSAIGVRVSLVKGTPEGSVTYQETHALTTNANGLLTFAIGSGLPAAGTYAAIDWENGPYFTRIELDLAGGTDYNLFTTSQLNSVPYALHARKADALSSPVKETDPVFEGSAAAAIQTADITGWNAKADAISAGDGIALAAGTLSIKPASRTNDVKVWGGSSWINKAISVQSAAAGGSQPLGIRSPYLGLSYQIALQGIFPSRNGMDPFLGEIMLFSGTFAIKGYALCDGGLLAIRSNAALFYLLGTTYGGDGTTTFALPDMRGRSAVHFGTGAGLSDIAQGQKGGLENVTISAGQMPTHSHASTVTFTAEP